MVNVQIIPLFSQIELDSLKINFIRVLPSETRPGFTILRVNISVSYGKVNLHNLDLLFEIPTTLSGQCELSWTGEGDFGEACTWILLTPTKTPIFEKCEILDEDLID